MMPCLSQCTEIFRMLCLCQFTEILQCPACVNLQRFYDALLMSFYREFTMLSLYQFTEIIQCLACASLQRFQWIKHPQKNSANVNFRTFVKDFVKSVNCQQFPLMSSDKIYNHFINILEIKIAEKQYKMNPKMVLQTFCITYQKVATI